MGYEIITNNPLVKREFENVYFVEGDFQAVMIEVRDRVHQGFELVSHPLSASVRMAFSPFRSIIVGEKNNNINPMHVEIIENSIINLKNLLERRGVDQSNAKDYALIDTELLKSTLRSFKENSSDKGI